MARRPLQLTEVLDLLQARGVRKARAEFDEEGYLRGIDVEFEARPVPVTPFRDAEGKPVDLDAGAGPLTRDPDESPAAEEPSDVALEKANFQRKQPAAS